jgi:prepilin-type N-terminal cleavage/methylation domain-containing protein
MIILFTLIELLVVIAIIALIAAALYAVSGNEKKTKALDKLRKKINGILQAGSANADDCAEVERLIISAQEAGVDQNVVNGLKEKISALCP